MALIICPECSNECSSEAVSCPNCGHPFASIPTRPVTVIERESEFPKWVIIPLTVMGAALLFLIIFLIQRGDETADSNVNVRVAKTPVQSRVTEVTDNSPTREVVVTSNPGAKEVVVTEPGSTTPSTTVTQVGQTASTPVSNKAVVKVSAKVYARNGTPRPVTKEKFYLLDKDLSSILSEANIPDEEGKGLKEAFALSVINPNKYREINQKALAAIKKHIVYTTMTDSQGNAKIESVKPDNYYIFAISATPASYAIWDAPVTVQVGENELILEPQTPTQVIVEDSRLGRVDQ